MSNDLGLRLVESGLVTKAMLAQARGATPRQSGGPLVEQLVRLGLSEQAVVGWMVAEGYGPVVKSEFLSAADATLIEMIPADMAHDLLVIPVRRVKTDVVVAMADPTDAHAIEELSYLLKARVIARVARLRPLVRAIATWYPKNIGEQDEEDLNEEQEGKTYPGVAPHGSSAVQDYQNYQNYPGVSMRPPGQRRRTDEETTQQVRRASNRPNVEATRMYATPKKNGDSQPPNELAAVQPLEEALSAGLLSDQWPVIPPAKKPFASDLPPKALTGSHDTFDSLLAEVRLARDVNKVLKAICRAALTVCRTVVVLRYRDWVFQGWEAEGPDITLDSVVNVRIPTGTDSNFRDVVLKGLPYFGPHGTAPADALFRIATRSHGRSLLIQPVFIGKRLVAALCADEVEGGNLGRQRLEKLALTSAEMFEKMIQTRKTHGDER